MVKVLFELNGVQRSLPVDCLFENKDDLNRLLRIPFGDRIWRNETITHINGQPVASFDLTTLNMEGVNVLTKGKFQGMAFALGGHFIRFM